MEEHTVGAEEQITMSNTVIQNLVVSAGAAAWQQHYKLKVQRSKEDRIN